MEKVRLTITGNMRVAPSVWRMQLEGDVKAIKSPGEFVNIAIDGLYLRRPISVCDKCRNTIILLYKVVGEGTERMSQMQKGEELEVLTGLGNGFCTDIDAQRVLLAGGGIGIAPLYWLAKELINKGKEVMAALCFNTGEEVFYAEAFEELGVRVYRVTVDGTFGTKGYVTDLIREKQLSFDYFYGCGPTPMLKALCNSTEASGEVSLEARMGCGFGICMGCSIETSEGFKRICKEGPVFKKEILKW